MGGRSCFLTANETRTHDRAISKLRHGAYRLKNFFCIRRIFASTVDEDAEHSVLAWRFAKFSRMRTEVV